MASARILDISSREGSSSPLSHFDTVPCDTRAIDASSACEMESTSLRMRRSALIPPLFENEFIRQGILFGNEWDSALNCKRSRVGFMQVAEVLHRITEAMDWTQSVLAKRIDVSQGTISKWNSGQQSPNKSQWDRVIALIRREPRLERLLSEIEPTGAVPVMGRIGAGSVIDPDFDQADSAGLYEVTLPFPVPDEMIGLEVDGESMMPKYDPGDVVVVWRDQRRDISAYIGQLAAVRTEDGRRFLKIILNGSKEGLYRLESFNAKPIVDVSISWVGEIHVIVPASQVRHLGARKQAMAQKKATRRAREGALMDELPLSRAK